MKLHRLEGATDLFRGGTNSGIYHLSDKELLIIDPGLSEARGKKIANYAHANKKIISHVVASHEHSDHIGALSGILETFSGCQVLIDDKGKYILEAPDAFLAYINGGSPNHQLRGYFRPIQSGLMINSPLKEGPFTIGEHTFEWLHFGGHSVGSGGLITPDKVLFLGDTLIPSEILDKFKLPLLYSVSNQYEAFKKIHHADYRQTIIGHGKRPLSKDQCVALAHDNKIVMENCLDLLLKALKKAQTKEYLMTYLVDKLNLSLNYKEYLFGMSSVASMLSYLIDENQVTVEIRENQLIYKLTQSL
jgi:glyoxylase-like metal-dependent hydrolase (beta-lactamase superfamily II)